MAVPESRPISLNTCLEVTKFLTSLVEDSYCHPKSSALILNSAGDIYFTRSGVNIIKETYCCHPIAKLIIDALGKHHKLTGDGCKLYILLLHEMLLAIKNKYNSVTLKTEHRAEILGEISQLMHKSLLSIFGLLRENHPSMQCFIDVDNSDDTVNSIKSLMKTFFKYKFPAAISRHLSCLMTDLICRSIADWKKLPFLVNYLISNFGILCCKAVASVQESCVVEGIVIRETPLSKLQNNLSNKSFVIVHDVFKNMHQCSIPILIQNDSTVKQSVELSYRLYSRVISILIANNVSVLLLNYGIPEEFASLCSEKNIFFIDRICEEQMEYVVNGTRVVPLHDFSEGIKPENIGCADFIKILIFGNNKYIHIGLPSKLDGIILHQVMLSAPFESLCRECYNECISSLKVIQQWIFRTQHCHDHCLCKTGRSCPNITKLDFSDGVSVLVAQNTTRPVTIYSDATKSDSLKPSISSLPAKGKNVVESHNNKKPFCNLLAVAYPVGFWEVSLNSALSSCQHLKNSALSIALTAVIRKKHNAKNLVPHHFPKENKHTHKKAQSSPTDSYSKTSELSTSGGNMEPVASKEKLVFSVLNLVVQLIRLDSVVSVKQLHNANAV